jgi:hypothetical protein
MLPFWLSIGLLSLTQGVVVALPGVLSIPWVERRRSRLWAAIPPLSVIVFVFVARAAERASAQSLTYLALVAVPVLAALALGWLERGPRPALALVVPVLFALAWVDRAGLAGQAAALALSALSCVTLGVLLAAVTPPRWLAAGIVLMACADTALVVSELLQRPNSVLDAAHPAAGLPRLQAAIFGSAAMGYGDLFVAGLLGGLLARGWPLRAAPYDFAAPPDSVRASPPGVGVSPPARARGWLSRAGPPDSVRASRPSAVRARQLRAAVLVAALALIFDLLFFAVDELPATVPVALALVLTGLACRRVGETSPGVSQAQPSGSPREGSPRSREKPVAKR